MTRPLVESSLGPRHPPPQVPHVLGPFRPKAGSKSLCPFQPILAGFGVCGLVGGCLWGGGVVVAWVFEKCGWVRVWLKVASRGHQVILCLRYFVFEIGEY